MDRIEGEHIVSRSIAFFLGLVFCTPVCAGIIYVDKGTTGTSNGQSWNTAFASLSTAIAGAEVGDEIWVKSGTYGPIDLKAGVRIYGGFGGSETTASQSDPQAYVTTISGGGTTRVVTGIDNDSSTVLRGFTIADGYKDEYGTGGGMYLKNSDALIVACVFTRNKAFAMGGAVANWGGSPAFINCKFFDNQAGFSGAGVWNRWSGAPSFVNCLFYDNRANEGGAVGVITGAPKFTNCTFAKNHATKGGGGAFFDGRGTAELRNCIVWGNSAVRIGTGAFYNTPSSGGSTSATYSNVQGAWSGTGITNADPLFANSADGNFRLQTSSPCATGGDSSLLPPDAADLDWDGDTTEPIPLDLALNAIATGSTIHMGAYQPGTP